MTTGAALGRKGQPSEGVPPPLSKLLGPVNYTVPPRGQSQIKRIFLLLLTEEEQRILKINNTTPPTGIVFGAPVLFEKTK